MGEKELGDRSANVEHSVGKAKEGATLARGIGSSMGGSSDDVVQTGAEDGGEKTVQWEPHKSPGRETS